MYDFRVHSVEHGGMEPKVILQLCPVASFLNSDTASVLVLLVDTAVLLVDTAVFEHY